MSNKNLSAVLYGINDLRIESTEIEEPKDDEVLLEMACVGICGSDVHFLVNGRICDFIVKDPLVLGHESSGTVVKTGKNVSNLKVGDRVAIEPGVPCRYCEYCKKGEYNLCPDAKFCATPPVHGTLRRFYKHVADFCYKLPDNVTLEEGALLEPLSVGVHACKRAQIGIGSSVLILGAGPIGLVTFLAAKSMGAKFIVVADIIQHKLKVAEQLGADAVYLVEKHVTEEENINNIQKLFKGEPNVTIDACGVESSIRLAVMVTKPGGTAVIVGMGSGEVKVPIIKALVKEVDIRGSFRYVNDYQDALDLVSKQKLNIQSLITHKYKIEDSLQAFETAKSAPGAIKVMIYCKEDKKI